MTDTNSSANNTIHVSGIDAESGLPLVDPQTSSSIARFVLGPHAEPPSPDDSQMLDFSLPYGTDASDVGSSGWGVVFAKDETDDVKKALAPLLDHRRSQAGEKLFSVLEYDGESLLAWLEKYGAQPGAVTPEKVPYYLLLVGAPPSIPYSFQYDLKTGYLVGRLAFDTPEQYNMYANSVVEYETSASVAASKDIVYFGVRNVDNRATALSCDHLVKPLAEGKQFNDFIGHEMVADRATKENLDAVMRKGVGGKLPSLLFTASHGLGFTRWQENGDKQRKIQGALVCQDWMWGTPTPDQYFAGSDVPADAEIHGAISFHFACFGAGTPLRSNFHNTPDTQPPQIAQRPFESALFKELLSHKKGGLLATIGHVERAWGYSIQTAGGQEQIRPFIEAIGRLQNGDPVGMAIQGFKDRYQTESVVLLNLIEDEKNGKDVDDGELSRAWTERNDARNMIVVGDPAVRLRVKDMA